MQTNNKLREAVKVVVDVGYPHNFQIEPPHIREYCYDITKAIEKCFDALAEPPRNCDVGTADDWLARFNVVCERCSGSDCDHRLFKNEEVCDCFARWLQMPYEEGGAK